MPDHDADHKQEAEEAKDGEDAGGRRDGRGVVHGSMVRVGHGLSNPRYFLRFLPTLAA